MSFLKLYLRQYIRPLLLFFLCGALLLFFFHLYGLPLQAVAYPLALCFLLVLLFAIPDLVRQYRLHRQLCAVVRISEELLLLLPAPSGVEAADLRQLLQRQLQTEHDERTALENRYQTRMEYYTLWAHQIKTPIASMRLQLQNEDSPFARRLTAELFRIEQYVEMAMAFLRLDSDATDYVIREQPLDPILRGAIRKFAGEFIDRRLKLQYEPVSVSVLTDEKWLSFVIEQLLSNALKYTPSGSVSLYMETPLTLCIRDTGIGIAAEDLPRIFEPGFTGGNGRLDKRASGIGLYLCRRVCERLGHRIQVESAPGQGTCVRLDLTHYELEAE